MSAIRSIISAILPASIMVALEKWLMKIRWSAYSQLSTREVFTKIYEDGVWGKPTDSSQKFYSGSGSNVGIIANTYIEAIHKVLSSFDERPDAVDLGCGDFVIGSKVRSLCKNYTACDIVESLIKFNIEKYEALNVDFRILDITKDELPKGDIAFVRQVLQHLSNEQIQGVLTQVSAKYKYLIVTEHLPKSASFVHNIDQRTGPDNRVQINSGIVVTSPPFNLKVTQQICLCEVLEKGGVIRTIFYKLA